MVARNWRTSIGEIDLVLTLGNLVVVCEVKSRASEAFGGPESAVGVVKQRRLRRLAAAWLAEAIAVGTVTEVREIRFDVVAVVGGKVRVVEGAF